MRVFTVHAREGEVPRTRLVREGFSLWAFLLGPFWLLGRGLWLTLIGYLVLAAMAMATAPGWGPWGMAFLQVMLGLHARDLERWTLRRRGFAPHGVVVGNDPDDALLRLLTAKPDLARGAIR